ncbi:thiamine phosphate synthase [Rhodocyclaceae bacterium]
MSSPSEGVLPLAGLYALTPDDNLLPRLSALVESALKGGVRWVQYRNKIAPAPLRRAQAAELLRICRAHGAKLIINDDIWLAVEIGADGAHLGRDDLPGGSLTTAREALGSKRILGVSCYDDLDRAEIAVDAGADYIAIGSVFASVSKPDAARASLDLVTEAKKRFKVPVCAIGGITVKNAPEVIKSGADMIAVLSDLFDAMDIQKQAEKFRHLFKCA